MIFLLLATEIPQIRRLESTIDILKNLGQLPQPCINPLHLVQAPTVYISLDGPQDLPYQYRDRDRTRSLGLSMGHTSTDLFTTFSEGFDVCILPDGFIRAQLLEIG